MTACTRCGRNVTEPLFAGGLAFGSSCFRKVVGSRRRVRAIVQRAAPHPPEADPRQRDLFAEVRP